MAEESAKTSSRRGRARKPKHGEAAEFVPGGAAAPKVFHPDAIAEDLNLWWEDGDGQSYVVGRKSTRGGDDLVWSRWPEKKVVALLREKFVRIKPREMETLSEVDRTLLHVMTERRLDMVLSSLAGYRAGLYLSDGPRMLVRSSPRLMKPVAGDWSMVAALIEGKLNGQAQHFHGWMKVALEALIDGGPGNFRPGQCSIFAGPRDSGKSRLQHQVITPLLGGRSADPGPYLFGQTDFNGEMFSAEHLLMEDPASSTKTADRIRFGEMLKQLVVNDTQRLHRKREDALVVAPFFRTTISINDDPDKLRVLPLLTPDMKDKVNLFLVSSNPLPMSTQTLQERQAFRARITSELPAYAHWLLNEFSIPEALRSVRFGVKEWHHPRLSAELFDDTPAAELLTLLDAAEFGGEVGNAACKLWDLESDSKVPGVAWSGSALDLEKLLIGEGGMRSSVEREARRLCMHNKIERLLGRLKEDAPDRIAPCRNATKRGWMIGRPPE